MLLQGVYTPYRECLSCRINQPIERFSKRHETKPWYSWSCIACEKEANRLEYRKKNPPKSLEVLEKEREKRKERKRRALSTKIGRRVRNRINFVIKTQDAHKIDHTDKLLGCSFREYIAHIESTWEKGMSWRNYGVYRKGAPRAWQIDHITPLASFDLTNPSEQIKAFHWKNTQALWADENLKKGDRLPCPANI